MFGTDKWCSITTSSWYTLFYILVGIDKWINAITEAYSGYTRINNAMDQSNSVIA